MFIRRIMAWVIPWTTPKCSYQVSFPCWTSTNKYDRNFEIITLNHYISEFSNFMEASNNGRSFGFNPDSDEVFIRRIMAWVIPWTTLKCSFRLRFPLLNRFPQTWQTAASCWIPLWNCLKWDFAFPRWVNSLAHIRHLYFWPSGRGASHWSLSTTAKVINLLRLCLWQNLSILGKIECFRKMTLFGLAWKVIS